MPSNLFVPKYKLHFSCKNTENYQQKCSRLIFVWTHGGRGINFLDGHGIHLHVSDYFVSFCIYRFIQGRHLRYEMELERHQKLKKCKTCNGQPDFPNIKFQMALEPAHQILPEKAMGLTRKSSHPMIILIFFELPFF